MQPETVATRDEAQTPELPLWFTALGLCAPAIWLATFATLVVRARLATGAWPGPGSIDPKEFGLHAQLVTLEMVLLMPLVPLVLLFLGVSLFDRRLRQPRALVIVFFASSALAAFVLFCDPGHFVEWLAD